MQAADGRPENLLWACHAAALCVGIGLVVGRHTLVAAGVLLLTIGVPLWLINLAAGGVFYPTSILTHVGGLGLGLIGLRRAGYPPHAPQWALALVGGLLLATRLATPPAENVNLAFAPWHGAESLAGSWQLHMAAVLAAWAVALLLADALVRRVIPT